MTDGKTTLVGLLGWPVEHSLSPAMHNAAFAALGLNWNYVPLPVQPGHVETAVRGLAVLGFRGANVTVPHKQAVIPVVDSIAADAKALGAVNTLVVNSLGMVEVWQFVIACNHGTERTVDLMKSPKETLEVLTGKELEKTIGRMLENDRMRQRYRIFFGNEYYPALIPVHDQMVLLHRAVDGLIERGALHESNREIIRITERLVPDWFVNSEA